MAIRMNAGQDRLAEGRFPDTLPIEQQLRLLVGYAILAPSTRNSQPWRFTIDRHTVRLYADSGRRLPAADPNCRELYLSLGCALENLLVAATCLGYRHEVTCFPDPATPELAAVVSLQGGTPSAPAPAPGATLDTLKLRRTPHRPFLERPVTRRVLDRLKAVAGEPGVRLSLCDSSDRRRSADVLSVRAVATLFGDEAYRQEMLGPGGRGTSWLASQAGRLTLSHFEPARRLAQQISALIRTSPVIGVIGSMSDTPADQLRSGRLFERLWLAATMEGLALQPIGYALQYPATREALSGLFPEAGAHAQQLVRLGYAAPRESNPTPRRPLDEVVSVAEHGRPSHAT